MAVVEAGDTLVTEAPDLEIFYGERAWDAAGRPAAALIADKAWGQRAHVLLRWAGGAFVERAVAARSLEAIPCSVQAAQRVLLCEQEPEDYLLRNVDYAGWMRAAAHRYGECEIRLRPHPRDCYARGVSVVPLAEDLAWADTVVAYSTTALVDAYLRGLRVDGGARFDFLTERPAWAARQARREFSYAALRSGEAWALIADSL